MFQRQPNQSICLVGHEQRNVQHIIIQFEIIKREPDVKFYFVREQLFKFFQALAGCVGFRLDLNRENIIFPLNEEIHFSLAELNQAIRRKLKEFVNRSFQKKEGTRYEIFRDEELPLLAKLPATPYELAEWKQATVQFNYHISVDGMLYSVPYEFIKRKVDVRVTDTVIEIFYNHNRIASHRRLYGRKGQYSTVTEHMPADHQAYLEWNGDRYRR